MALCVAAVLVSAASAYAHGVLTSSSPAAGANLSIAPTELRLTFSERPEPVFTRVTLTDPTGSLVALDSALIRGNVVTAAIRGALIAGTYTVEWRTAGRDGHPVRGDYTFTIAEGAAGIVAGTALSDTAPRIAPADGIPAVEVSETSRVFVPLTIVLRWLTLTGVVMAIGAVTFRFAVLSRVARVADEDIATRYLPAASRAAATLGLLSVALVGAVAVARLFVQAISVVEPGQGTLQREFLGSMLLHTAWGHAWMIQVSMVVLAAAAFARARKRPNRSWLLAGVGSVGIALGLSLSGHAVVVPELATATVLAHVVHTVGASGWLGTLLALAVIGLPLALRLDRDDRWTVVAKIVHTFSPAALAFASITVLAGVFIAWTHLGSVQALWTSEYGRVLMLKLGMIGATLTAGAYNWQRARPGLGEASGTRRLQRSASVELVLAGLVIVITAVLVGTPMPMQ